ncbi:MAG TPA: triphosphoribosyl-dephospho-CoA synthase [Novimethylophilus sp.]|uniref:triphosphoribosyl-dephospho-CoA synthase n=1 Tax=Novimethylophilus sp. TaxID=2137426 RepID=UPI002F3FAC99
MPSPLPDPQTLAAAFEAACLAELQAIKPGNVHVFADGHNMVVDDFVKSAHAAASVIALQGLTVGQRILHAVEATWAAAGCNTNLGIVLLAAPLLHSALSGRPLAEVLGRLTVEDASLAFRAILRASPAGLGNSPRHDVRQTAQVTLLEAMCESATRDRIAYQYATAYEDVLGFAVPRYHEAYSRWGSANWATTAVYLGLMARFPDSHVMRKYGEASAASLRIQAEKYDRTLIESRNPEHCLDDLLGFDAGLKRQGLNPGTSADLTVATLLAVAIEKYLKPGSK